MIAVALVAGCTATDTAPVAQDCETVANQTIDASDMPLAMPENLLDLGTGGGVYCFDTSDGSRVMWLYSPVTSGSHQTFWIVANSDLVSEQEVERFLNDQTEHDLSVELVDTHQLADYYLASTDLDTALAAAQTSTNTLSIADYAALRMTR